MHDINMEIVAFSI